MGFGALYSMGLTYGVEAGGYRPRPAKGEPVPSQGGSGLVRATPRREPVRVLLFCPRCRGQHVDRGEWATTRVHETHLCEHCKHEWRPADVPTIGVESP